MKTDREKYAPKTHNPTKNVTYQVNTSTKLPKFCIDRRQPCVWHPVETAKKCARFQGTGCLFLWDNPWSPFYKCEIGILCLNQYNSDYWITGSGPEVIKAKLCLSTPWRYIGGVEVKIHPFLTLAVQAGKWSTACSGCFNPGNTGTNWIRSWVCPAVGLDVSEKRKKLPYCCWHSNHGHATRNVLQGGYGVWADQEQQHLLTWQTNQQPSYTLEPFIQKSQAFMSLREIAVLQPAACVWQYW